MKSYLKYTTASAAVLAMAAPVHADQYVTVFGGMTFMDGQSAHLEDTTGSGTFNNSTTFTFLGTFVPTTTLPTGTLLWVGAYGSYFSAGTYNSFTTLDGDYDFDNGYVIGAAWGCDLGALSIEGEIAYRANDFEAAFAFSSALVSSGSYTSVIRYASWTNTGGGWTFYNSGIAYYLALSSPQSASSATAYTDVAHSDINATSIMANVWWEFSGIEDSNITPYVGAGVGWASVEASIGPSVGNPRWNTDDSGLAWQVGAGVRFGLRDNLSLNIEYRYFAVPDVELFVAGNDLGFDYEMNNVIVGLRMDF